MASTGISSSSEGAGWPPIRTSRPRPRPRRGTDSGALDKLHRHLPIGVGSGGATVVGNRGQTVTRRLGKAHRPRHGRTEYERAEMAAYFRLDLGGEARAAVEHREEDAADRETRVET